MGEGGGASGSFSTRAAARILAVPPERIRYWVRRRFISPSATRGRRYRFAFKDLLVMRLAKELLPSRRHLEPVQRAVERVRAMVGASRPVSSLKLENLDGRIVVRDGPTCFEAETGQIIFDFEQRFARGKVDDRFGIARARERFDEARRLAEEDPLRALSLYSNLATHEPVGFETHMHLAALLEEQGDLAGALRHLLGAASAAPANAEVYMKLGLMYRKLGAADHAIRSLLQAVECDPALITAHRNLADLYEQAGRQNDALRHLSAIHRLLKGGE
jgi:tetratricopeptide (TPR) repeat protein